MVDEAKRIVAKTSREPSRSLVGKFIVALRRFPLFYKVLVANTLLIAVSTLVAIWVTSTYIRNPSGYISDRALLVWLENLVLLVTILVNYLILKGALQPIGTLRRLANNLEAGKMDARAVPPFFTDAETERLIKAINQTLDQLQQYQARVRMLSQRGTHSLEAERMRISRELHDETSQVLTALLITERMLLNSLVASEHRQTVQQILDTTRRLLVDVQRICMGLRPPVLDDLGLPGALQSYVEGFLPKGSPRVCLEIDENLPRFPADVELALYRIAQEALTNVVRHASAQNVHLSLACSGGRLLLSVRDDGTGFQSDALGEVVSQEHLGLFGMQERAILVGGKVTVQSSPGQGTTVQASIPVTESSPV